MKTSNSRNFFLDNRSCTFAKNKNFVMSQVKHYNSVTDLFNADNASDFIQFECGTDKIPSYTLAIFMEDVFPHKDLVFYKILKCGLTVINEKYTKLSSEQAYEFVSLEFYDDLYADYLLYLSSQPMIVLCLAGCNAIYRWSTIIKDLHVDLKNCVLNAHSLIGSDNDAIARKQIGYFFPDLILEPIDGNMDDNEQYLRKNVLGILQMGLKEVCIRKPKYPLLFLANWLSENRTKFDNA